MDADIELAAQIDRFDLVPRSIAAVADVIVPRLSAAAAAIDHRAAARVTLAVLPSQLHRSASLEAGHLTMDMDKLVSLCKRRGFLFQSSEIYGGLNGFWDYGPLGVELKRNVKEAWWRDMVTGHDDLDVLPGAPEAYEMTGLDCTIIMHPQVWKCSGHYDLFHDYMVDCRESKKRYRHDQVRGRWVEAKGQTDLRRHASRRRRGAGRDAAAGAQVLQPARQGRRPARSGRATLVSLTTVKDFARCSAPTPRSWARSPSRANST